MLLSISFEAESLNTATTAATPDQAIASPQNHHRHHQ
jgi:hypothetical protein